MLTTRNRGFAVMPVLVSSLLFLLLIATMLVMSRADIAVAVDAEKEGSRVLDSSKEMAKLLEPLLSVGKTEFEGYYVGLEYGGRFVPFTAGSGQALDQAARILAKRPVGERGAVLVRGKNLDGTVGEVVSDPGSRARDLEAKEALWKRYLEGHSRQEGKDQ